jgi:hypothetical protein
MAEKRSFSPDDWQAIADWVIAEKERRDMSPTRREKVRLWDEIDRQTRMEPRPVEVTSGRDEAWLPNTELPLQFNTLEVNAADSRRLKFPRGTEWYKVSSNLSDKYAERWNRRRQTSQIIGGTADGKPIPNRPGNRQYPGKSRDRPFPPIV